MKIWVKFFEVTYLLLTMLASYSLFAYASISRNSSEINPISSLYIPFMFLTLFIGVIFAILSLFVESKRESFGIVASMLLAASFLELFLYRRVFLLG